METRLEGRSDCPEEKTRTRRWLVLVLRAPGLDPAEPDPGDGDGHPRPVHDVARVAISQQKGVVVTYPVEAT